VIAVSSSMTATYCNKLFKDQIEQVNNITGGYLDEYLRWLIISLRYINAEAVLSFVITTPLIIVITIAFVENTFRVEYELSSENTNETTMTKIKV
jgi:hypothetical protein